MGAVVIAGTLVPASPASAAVGNCNATTLALANQGYLVTIPYFTDGVSGGDCSMNRYTQRSTAPAAVKALQDALCKCYGSGLSADGVFGPITESALMAAQRKERITADGKYGPQTAHALAWPLYRQSDRKFLYCWKR